MRRQTLKLTASFVILAITFSFVAVLPVTGRDTGLILSKLETLRGKVEDIHPPALENKIKAVMHQIEAGAFNSALNKLQNDVREFIQAKVENPEELIRLVDEIINLIIGITPPDFEISATPHILEVMQGSLNNSIITVTSKNNFNQEVHLTNATAASSVTLSLNTSSVVPPKNGTIAAKLNVAAAVDATLGNYEITVTGTSSGFEPKIVEIELIIMESPPPPPEEDETPPTIASVLRNPETPAYNESVAVTAFVLDEGGSGVKQVTLNYSGGNEWTSLDMILSEGLYKKSIQAFPFNTTVEYRVTTSDNNGNTASSILFSYKVIDPYPPLLRIYRPQQGSYLSGTVAITVVMKDQNSGGESGFANAELSINGTVVKTWVPPAPSGPDTYSWNTAAFGADGLYAVKLKVLDKAGNIAEKSLTVTVDNTLPTAVINTPTDESYLRLSVLIKVTGSDTNFDKMEVRIDDELIRTSFTSGTEVIEWNTQGSGEGVHSITLAVYDKAGNSKNTSINVTTDNTPPLIGTPSWSPKEPTANEDIQVNVTVTEPAFGSGVKNVTLWYKNTTMTDYKSILMEFKDGNWTTILKNQSDTQVRFFIQAIDKSGNSKASTSQDISVSGPAGFPLIWILLIIIIILVASGAAIYYMGRKRKKSTGPSPTTTAT